MYNIVIRRRSRVSGDLISRYSVIAVEELYTRTVSISTVGCNGISTLSAIPPSKLLGNRQEDLMGWVKLEI